MEIIFEFSKIAMIACSIYYGLVLSIKYIDWRYQRSLKQNDVIIRPVNIRGPIYFDPTTWTGRKS